MLEIRPFQEEIMRSGKIWIFAIVLATLALTGSSYASDRYVRLRSVEGEVTIYPADGQRPNEATINSPLLDGDEIETGNGRAELSFRNGITLRIGDSSGIRLESSYSPMRIDLLRGTVFLDSHLIDRFRDELIIRAGGAEVFLIDEGNLRVDLGSEGSVRVTTIEGQAEVLAGGSRVLLNSGERTYVDPGRSPLEPEQFRGEFDELDEWNAQRMDYYASEDFTSGYNNDYVDEDIYYDAYDLGGYGDWRNSGTYGYVWVPHVDYGWRPYYNGRWLYTGGSWFWASYEPWGWAPYHYGRWGWSLDFGWYWIPGNVFAPAWVSWYSYGDYVGWCPLNYYGRPIYYYDDYYRYPAIQKQKTLDASNSWTFVKKDDLGVRNIKTAVLDSSRVRNIKIDKNAVTTNPKRELVSYVIPQKVKGPGYVNDKRLIKEPGEMKSPIGIKNREDQFERGRTGIKGGSANTNKGKTAERTNEKTFKEPVKIQPRKPEPKPKSNFDREKTTDRDWQFKRTDDGKASTSRNSNPYYNVKPRSYDRNDSPEKISPWYRRPSENEYDRPNDVSPRYRDEARKYFERFDHKNRGDSDRAEPKTYDSPQQNYEPPKRSYEPPKRSYEPPKRNYEAPKREYKAPEIKRNDNRSGGNSNRSKPSGNSNNNRKRQ
jgi:hypothetical protein